MKNQKSKMWLIFLLVIFPLSLALADSLWQDKKESMYSKPQARKFQVHDLITIAVVEEESANIQGNYKSDRRTRWEDILSKWIRISSDGSVDKMRIKEALKGVTPEINMDSRLRNDNIAQQKSSMSIKAKIQAEIKDILPNGNLVIEARKYTKVNGNEEVMTIKGIVNSKDIDESNVVLSEKIANLEFKIESKGTVGDTQKQGWLSKLINKLWPF